MTTGMNTIEYAVEVRVPLTFKGILVSYMKIPDLTPSDRAHLQKWARDDRADEEGQTVDRATLKRGVVLPPNTFIREILATRRVAEAIASRGKYRRRYRKYAKKMEEI